MSTQETILDNTVKSILDSIGGTLDASTMAHLNPDQITLLAYSYLRTEVLEGGFIQLIHNGYGPFIFFNPFAKAIRLWGQDIEPAANGGILHDFSKLIYSARRLFELYQDPLTADMSDEDFMALYEQYPDFDELDDTFIDQEEDITAAVVRYIQAHAQNFIVAA